MPSTDIQQPRAVPETQARSKTRILPMRATSLEARPTRDYQTVDGDQQPEVSANPNEIAQMREELTQVRTQLLHATAGNREVR